MIRHTSTRFFSRFDHSFTYPDLARRTPRVTRRIDLTAPRVDPTPPRSAQRRSLVEGRA